MNWIHFLLWVAGIYFLYYLAVVLFDLAFAGRSASAQPATNELTFSAQVQPQKLEHNTDGDARKTKSGAGNNSAKPGLEPEMIASGGVALKELFSLARQEAIVYTGQVSY